MDKAALRQKLASLPPIGAQVSSTVSSHLFAWLSKRLPGTVASFRAMTDEVDISSLVERLPGWRWLLPRVESGADLTWRDARGPLERHVWGMEQPTASGPSVPSHEIDFYLVPGLAFDGAGNRLGRGRGFYDRQLAAKRADSVVVGVTVDDRIVDAVPVADHDFRVRYLATESGVIEAIPTT